MSLLRVLGFLTCFCFLQLVTSIYSTRICYYECPMEGTMVDLSKYPTVSNQTAQLEKYTSMDCPTTKRASNLKWLLATKDELLFDGETRLTNDSRYDLYDRGLAITPTDVEHEGVYVCMTKYGKPIAAVVLDVRDDPPQMHKQIENESATLGGTAHLSCNGWNLRYETTKYMNWTFNDELIFIEGTSLVDPRFWFWSWSLTISDIALGDKGAYRCYINTGVNILGKVSYLDVYTPPKLYSTIASRYYENEVIEGSNVALTCKSRSHPVANIRWTSRSYHDMHCREHIETITTGCSFGETMLIKNITRSCYSSYVCEARNEIYTYPGTEGRQYFSLSVAYAPEVEISQSEITAIVGDAIIISCFSSSKPTWWKDGTMLTESHKYEMKDKSRLFFLTVNHIMQSDQGLYKCQVENYIGIGSDSVTLTVKEQPADSLNKEVIDSQSCEKIIVPICQNLWYNTTPTFPSVLHPEVSSQTDLLPVLYSYEPQYNPKLRCAKFIYVDCARHMPPCVEANQKNEVILPCRKICETARSECSEHQYKCDDLPNTGPCTTHKEIVTVKMTVDPTELEVTLNGPVTLRCRVKTNARLYQLYFGINNGHKILRNSSGYVAVTRTETNGVHVLEAQYNAFSNIDITQFVCILKTEAFDIEKTVPVRVSENFQITPMPEASNYVHLGQDKTLSCKVYSYCNITSTSWSHYAGLAVEPSDNVKLSAQHIDANTMLMEMSVSNATTENTGSFECVASNGCGKIERAFIRLSVAVVPNVVASSPEVYEVIGGEATLECLYRDKVYPNPNTNILWKKRLEVISRDTETPGFMTFNSQLIVLNVTQERLGTYTCFARNQFGWSYQDVTLKEIPGKPPVVDMDFDVDGKQVVIDCVIHAKTNISLAWYKGRRKLTLTNIRRPKYVFTEVSSTLVKGYKLSRFAEKEYTEYNGRLTIKRFIPVDLDVYTCVGSNRFGNASDGHNLTAYIGPPTIYNSYSRNVKASVGEEVLLHCYIGFDFKHTTAWKRAGAYLESTDRYTITSESRRRRTNLYLKIEQVVEEDFGEYTCVAENKFGRRSHTLTLSQK